MRANIEYRDEKPVEENDGEANVGSCPPWTEKRGAVVGDLTPVEGYETHIEAMSNTEQLIDLDIIRSDPADP
jgi:hypothetical protein